MGLNVCVQTLSGKPHPEWDDGRYAGDRMLFEVAAIVPREDRILDEGWGGANDWFWRPADFAAFRQALGSIPDNADRWAQLAAILERDPDYWIYLSV